MSRTVVIIMVALLVVGALAQSFRVELAGAAGTIYIRADGAIEGTDKIVSSDNATYTFISNIEGSVVVERSKITIDGSNFVLQGSGDEYGLYMTNLSNVTIKNARIRDFVHGLYVLLSLNITIAEDEIASGGLDGITLETSSNCTISGNHITGCDTQIVVSHSLGNTIACNTMENGAGGILVWNSSDNVVSENDIVAEADVSYPGCGIHLGSYSKSNFISRNNVTKEIWDVYCTGLSFNNTFVENRLIGDNRRIGTCGIYFLETANNTIVGNHITRNDAAITFISSRNCTITENNLVDHHINALGLFGSDDNTITDNNLMDTLHDGLDIIESQNNRIFHNNFVNNSVQAHLRQYGYANIWDDSYPSGGNYWADYNGSDAHSGPGQNEPGSDGIGDTATTIDDVNIDHYPLMNPCAGAPAYHDIEMATVTPCRRITGRGLDLDMSCIIANHGLNPETLNVTIYANGTEIAFVPNLTVDGRGYVTLNTTCGASLLGYGDYLVSACAEPVPGEIDSADNNCTGGWIFVSIPGDIAEPYRLVDIFDVVRITGVYESRLGDPEYRPNSDIDGNGIVDIFDVVACTGHYDESW